MYNRKKMTVARKNLFGCREGQKVLFSRNVKPGMFRLGIALKEIFLAYSTHFVFLTIRLVLGSVVIGEWIYEIT